MTLGRTSAIASRTFDWLSATSVFSFRVFNVVPTLRWWSLTKIQTEIFFLKITSSKSFKMLLRHLPEKSRSIRYARAKYGEGSRWDRIAWNCQICHSREQDHTESLFTTKKEERSDAYVPCELSKRICTFHSDLLRLTITLFPFRFTHQPRWRRELQHFQWIDKPCSS